MICVFDGRHLAHKQDTVNKRKSDRENNMKKGEELIQKGQEEEGKKYIQMCIKVDEKT
jgi:5'-3' exonuclease